MEQLSPPGYVMLLSSEEMMNAEMFAEDAERLRNLPQAVILELRDYLKDLLAGIEREDSACIWFDENSMRCRHHEHRPSVCRDFEVGSEDCVGWRERFDLQ
jgi:Fe-S-cluster containining protein